MEKTVRAKAYAAPTLWVEIDDLRVPCAVPTVALTTKIVEKAGQFMDLDADLSQERYDYAFDLFAEILSCNHDFVKFTADELKAKHITITQIIGVLTEWVRFIGDLAEEKN